MSRDTDTILREFSRMNEREYKKTIMAILLEIRDLLKKLVEKEE